MNNILKPFKEYFTINKNGEYSHLKRTMLTVFHVRFVFVLFETLGFCKSARVVFPDLIPIFCVSLLHISSVVKGYVYDLEIILLFVLSEIWYIFNKSE